MSQAIRIHPKNHKYFEFRGKPLAFVTATEHYGAVMNRPFRFERYLAEGEPAGLSFVEWVKSPMYDPAGLKADFRAGAWGSLVSDGYGDLWGEPWKTMPKDSGVLKVFALQQ